jgi:tRNA-dihydrouridine synthase B
VNVTDSRTRIGGVTVSGRVSLAPLAGVTDLPFRLLCKAYGAAMMTTEMTSAEGIVRAHGRTHDLVRFDERERPIAVQLCGSDPESMARAASVVMDGYDPDWVDVNFGCPVRKIVGKGAGSACLREPDRVGEIIEAMTAAIGPRVTAKIRSGWDRPVAHRIAGIVEEAGAVALSVHGRTREQGYGGEADWGVVADVVSATDRLCIIGNGDVTDAPTARRRFAESGCSLVMIGRGAIGQPWIFRQILHELATGEALEDPHPSERLEVAARHYELAIDTKGAEPAAREMRRHLIAYLRGVPDGDGIRRSLLAGRDASAVLSILRRAIERLRALEHRAGLAPTAFREIPRVDGKPSHVTPR